MLPLPHALRCRHQRCPTSDRHQHGNLLRRSHLCEHPPQSFEIFLCLELTLFFFPQIDSVGLAPAKASLALGGLGIAGLAACIFGCLVLMERREFLFSLLFFAKVSCLLFHSQANSFDSRSCQAHDLGSRTPLHRPSPPRCRSRECRKNCRRHRGRDGALPLPRRLQWFGSSRGLLL